MDSLFVDLNFLKSTAWFSFSSSKFGDDLHHGDEAPVRGDDALAGLRGPQGVEQRGWVVLHDALPAAREVGRHGGDLPDGGNDGGGVGGEALGLEERDA